MDLLAAVHITSLHLFLFFQERKYSAVVTLERVTVRRGRGKGGVGVGEGVREGEGQDALQECDFIKR